ncbi:peptide deformylase, mitochondrial [Vipera latastei]
MGALGGGEASCRWGRSSAWPMAARSWDRGLRGILRASLVPCRPHGLAFSDRPWGELGGGWRKLRRRLLSPCEPPFQRVCLVGDPALRGVAAPVEPGRVGSAEVQRLISRLVAVMRREGCVGLSAPQLGVPLQVFVAEFRGPPLPEELRALEAVPFPLRVFVNPAVRVLDSRPSYFTEGCASLPGFSAVVARHMGVEVSGEAGARTGGRRGHGALLASGIPKRAPLWGFFSPPQD